MTFNEISHLNKNVKLGKFLKSAQNKCIIMKITLKIKPGTNEIKFPGKLQATNN